MKLQAVVLSIVFGFMSINPAVAGGRHGHHNSHHYGGHGHHYNSHYSYGHHDSHGYNLAYGLGGLLVGGIIGATLTNSYNNGPSYNSYRVSNYVTPQPVNNVIKPSFILQPNGACYLINNVSNGNMVLSPVSPGNCE